MTRQAELTAEEIEAALERPEYRLKLTSEKITAKPRRLPDWPRRPPEPSAVERLAALEDPEIAERIAKTDKRIAMCDEIVLDFNKMMSDR